MTSPIPPRNAIVHELSQGVFYELPKGKIGKNGKVVVQKGQKGETSFFYAIKKLLSQQQLYSPTWKNFSIRRKIITQLETPKNYDEFYERRLIPNLILM